jgi:hypothetical protein
MLAGPAELPEQTLHADHQLLIADGCDVKTGLFKSVVLSEPVEVGWDRCLAASEAEAPDGDGGTDSGASSHSLLCAYPVFVCVWVCVR